MDAVKFLEEERRMRKSFHICDESECPYLRKTEHSCYCAADSHTATCGVIDHFLCRLEPQIRVQIVEEWSKKNQLETRQTRFLKLFPNAPLDKDGIIDLCPKQVDTGFKDRSSCHKQGNTCDVCCSNYWGVILL